MSESNVNLREQVRAFWQANPCGTKFNDAEPGTRRFYELWGEDGEVRLWHSLRVKAVDASIPIDTRLPCSPHQFGLRVRFASAAVRLSM